MAGSTVQEFVVRLGTQIDNSGFQQMLALLDSNKLKAMGVTAALTAATTAVYKFVESVTKEEFELRRLARQKNKHLENLRAEQTALKAMGMTLNEIKKDKALQEIYKDIENTNKALALPNLESTLKTVRGLQGAFWKLRSVADYTIEWIGAKVLSNLDVPMKRFTGYFDMITQWVRDKMPYITTKVATYITDFSKGIIGIGEGIGKVFKFINELPDGIKMVGGAVIGLWALIKSGPIGQILTAVTVIGDIIHDYDNYRKVLAGESNVPVGLAPVYEEYDKNGMAGVVQKLLKGIGGELKKAAEGVEGIDLMKILFGSSFDSESAGKFVQKLLGNITDKANELLTDENAQKAGGAISTVGEAFVNLLTSGINSALDLLVGKVTENGGFEGGILLTAANLVEKFVGFLGETIRNVDFADIGTGIGNFLNGLIERLSGFIREATTTGTALFGTLYDSASALASGVLDILIAGMDALLTENPETGRTGIEGLIDSLFDSLTTALSGLTEKLSGDLANPEGSSFQNIGTKLGEAIGKAIRIGMDFLVTFVTDAIKWIGENPDQLIALGEAIAGAIVQGFYGIFDGLMTAIFGEEWGNTKEKQATAEELNEVFSDSETVVGESGKIWTKAEASDTLKNAKNAKQMRQEFGLDKKTAFQNLYGAVLDELGFGNLAISAEGKTIASGNIITPYEAVARAYGASYDNARYLNYNGTEYDGDESFGKIVNSLINATDEESLVSAVNKLNGVMEELGVPVKDVEGAFSKAKDTVANSTDALSSSLQELSATVEQGKQALITFFNGLKGAGGDGSGSDGPGKAYGGRIGSRGIYEVGEDGPEYIVPITKPDRAFDVLMQMFGEMGGGMLSKLASSFGLGESGTVGSTVASLSNALQDMTVNNTYNISAPVTMYINSTASAEDVGNTAYSMIDRHLINTLRGAYA